jgi:predicted enzyme related to lactoylglutathione lyase
MSEAYPFGTTRATQYVFGKTFVHDLEAMAAFYEEVFGLIPLTRHNDTMLGREITEIIYQSTFQGGPTFTMIKYLDSTGPQTGESVQGFMTDDMEALIARALAAGGTVPEPIRSVPAFGVDFVFVLDPEGHINEVTRMSVA